jgi:lipoprotein-releasing system permease protein
LILLPFEDAQVYFKLKDNGADAVNSIEVMGDDPEQAQGLARQIADTAGPGFRIYDWKSSNNHIFQAVIVQRNVMFLILMLIILVASFNIISSLIMLVREKGRDVAILRTMGATRGSIMRIFFTCGASVGVIGTIIGVLLGLLIAFNTENIQLWLESMMGHKLFADELYFLSHLPSKVDGSEVFTVVIMALSLSFLATIYPARRAARLDPAEALRYE